RSSDLNETRDRHPGSKVLRAPLIVLAFLTICVAVQGQGGTTLNGHVTDEHGAAIRAAEAQLRSRSGLQSFTYTDDNGAYSFKNIVAGQYVLEIKAKGFATFTSKELNITRGQAHIDDFDVRLSVKAVSESVVVTATGTAKRTDGV